MDAGGRELVALEAGRLTLGTDPANDLALAADPTLSRLHAVLERYEAGWCVRDLGSRNGIFVNGQHIWAGAPAASSLRGAGLVCGERGHLAPLPTNGRDVMADLAPAGIQGEVAEQR
jgi:hypothetical protein